MPWTLLSKLLRIVNDLLDAAKIEEGRFGYKFENVNIVTFIEDVIKEVGDFAKQHNIKVYLKGRMKILSRPPLIRAETGNGFVESSDNAIRYNVKTAKLSSASNVLKTNLIFR